jgi:hypothetical protein
MGFISYLKKSLHAFLRSFQPGMRFLYVILIDILFYGLVIIGSVFWSNLLIEKFAIVKNAPAMLLKIESIDPAVLSSETARIQGAFTAMIAYVIIGVILLFILYSLAKGAIWTLIFKKKHSVAFYLRFAAASLMFAVSFILLALAAYYLVQEDKFVFIFVFIMLPISVYLLFMLHIMVTFTGRIWAGIRDAFAFGVGKLHLFILPFAILSILLFLIILLLSAVSQYLPDRLYAAIALLTFILFSSWSKFYLAEMVHAVRGKA